MRFGDVRSAGRAVSAAVSTLSTLAALAALVVLLTAPAAGAEPAQSADATVRSLRADADRASAEYFDALGKTQALDTQIAEIQRRLPDLRARRQALQRSAEQRAVSAYKRSGDQLGAIIASRDVLSAARRTVWLDRLNARDNDAFAELGRVSAQLETQTSQLRDARATQAATLAEVEARGRDIDAKLQAAEDRSRQLAAQAAQAAQAQAAQAQAPRPVAPKGAGGAPPVAPPDYQPTPGTHPRHDDPFLACTRAHEGSYTSYNPAGPYMGAYQFLQSTWNSAANHAGRSDLVGVPPNTASEYDQDDVAWSLYQWRGAEPWGGRCV
jgi:predicted  nucleic acid-binding Zn-ribbon protein